MKTPTDTELLDYLDKLANNKSYRKWGLSAVNGNVYVDNKYSLGTNTVREAIIKHMEKSKETVLTN